MLVAISGSPSYMVSKFAKVLGFYEDFGSVYESGNNIFTGKVLNKEIFLDKAFVLKKFLRERKLQADWANSLAVGDTETDVAMLELVGRPVAFNPNTSLAVQAKDKGWEIVVERKDVVYGVKDFAFLNR
jgi:phosphoserine phosphatase